MMSAELDTENNAFDTIDIKKNEDEKSEEEVEHNQLAEKQKNNGIIDEVVLDNNDDDEDIGAGDDDGEIFRSSISNHSNVSESTRRISSANLEDVLMENSDYFIEIEVSEPQKIGDGIGSYLAYKVRTKTNIPKFQKNEFQTLRRFSDFLGLHALLVSKYLRLGRIIPPAPSKNIFGSTKVKMSPQQSEPGNELGLEWVEIRRAALKRFLNRLAQHVKFRQDPDFINFLENDKELPKSVNTAALSGAGVMRLFNKVGETVNKITYKMDENDPWFDEKITEVENLDRSLQKLNAALKTLVTNRKELSTLTGQVAKSAEMLSTCEEHTSLSRALSGLADVEEKIELLRSEQANSDFFILLETVKDYLGLFGAIKCVFHERVKVFQNWQHAQLQLTKRRENKAKLELANRNDKLEHAQLEVDGWEGKVHRCQKEFDDISAEVKQEMDRFDVIKVKEIKSCIIKHLEDQMAHQLQIVKYWEAFSPAANEIA